MDLLERCLFIEALVGNVTSHTTVKKEIITKMYAPNHLSMKHVYLMGPFV